MLNKKNHINTTVNTLNVGPLQIYIEVFIGVTTELASAYTHDVTCHTGDTHFLFKYLCLPNLH